MQQASTYKILVIANVWPEPSSSAAGWRMQQLLETFISQRLEVHFACTAQPSDQAIDLESKGVMVVKIAMNDAAVNNYLNHLQPDFVVFDRFMVEEQFGWRVAACCPNAVRILNTEDLHCLRYSRAEAYKNGLKWTVNHLLESDHAIREIASIHRSDLSLVISSYEMTLLKDLFHVSESSLYYLPFWAEAGSRENSFEERHHFVSIGNFRHEPNRSACEILKTEIWPIIRKTIPKAELHIYGAYADEKIRSMHSPEEGFVMKGWAESAREVISKARLLLAPLPFGAGLKGKLLECMQYGTPSITTSIGAEGMGSPEAWNGAVCDDWQEFADNAVSLHQNKNLWKEAQLKGRELLLPFANPGAYQQLVPALQMLSDDLENHRKRHFIGKMLNHHHHRSTEFMSRWIELKNKQ